MQRRKKARGSFALFASLRPPRSGSGSGISEPEASEEATAGARVAFAATDAVVTRAGGEAFAQTREGAGTEGRQDCLLVPAQQRAELRIEEL